MPHGKRRSPKRPKTAVVLHGRNRIPLVRAPVFQDRPYWDKIIKKHLPQYVLPSWGEPCTLENMKTWADRLDVKEHTLVYTTATTFKEFHELNHKWPLRAWIGLLLETKAE